MNNEKNNTMNHKSEDHFKDEFKDDFDIDIQACSATDCTGLIPSLPQTEAERESYEAIYPYSPSSMHKPT